MEKAKRYNSGKLRYELLPTFPLQEIVRVYSYGAHKYTVYENDQGERILGKDIPFSDASKYKVIDSGADNWRKGLPWMDVVGCAKRHIEAFVSGEDMDELGTYHLSNAIWNLITLLEYYKTHPELDNRLHPYLNRPKIGLDIDEVLADFVGAMMERFPEMVDRSIYWADPHINNNFGIIKADEKFWMNIKPKVKHDEIPFEPHCYITSRPISTEITKAWLNKNGFPDVPIYTVGHDQSKIEVAKKSGIDWFVDDRYSNFVELNSNGVCCFLFSAPHNERYDVGFKRIKTLKELV